LYFYDDHCIYCVCSDNPPDATLHACCCASSDYCNIPSVFGPIPTLSTRPPVRVCWEGLSTTNTSFGSDQVCYGDCASFGVVGTISGTSFNTTYYTCEPLTVCRDFGLINSCGSVNFTGGVTTLQANITACCCNRDGCNNPNGGSITVPTGPPPARLCYVGLAVPSANYSNGGAIMCNGLCANATFGVGVSNTGVNIYTCDPFQVCQTLGITNTCG
jgi:hypothetical protein